MILPGLVWCASAGKCTTCFGTTEINLTHFEVAGVGATVQAPKVTSFGGSFVRWIMAFYATAFTNNLMTTGRYLRLSRMPNCSSDFPLHLLVLLAYRIWYVDRRTMGLRGRQRSKLRKILHIIIDAGVIYNLTLLAVWICFSLELNGQFVALDIVSLEVSLAYESNPTEMPPWLSDRAHHLHHILHGDYSCRVGHGWELATESPTQTRAHRR